MNKSVADERDEADDLTADDFEKVSATQSSKDIINKQLDKGVILFVDPNQSNERIIMQQGLFMFPYNIDREKHLSVLESNTDLIKIHKKLRKELLAYLDSLGFNTFRLMPDLASICGAIKKKSKEI